MPRVRILNNNDGHGYKSDTVLEVVECVYTFDRWKLPNGNWINKTNTEITRSAATVEPTVKIRLLNRRDGYNSEKYPVGSTQEVTQHPDSDKWRFPNLQYIHKIHAEVIEFEPTTGNAVPITNLDDVVTRLGW